MSKKNMQKVDVMSLSGSADVQVMRLLDMIVEVFCNTSCRLTQKKMLWAMKYALRLMTETYVSCIGCDGLRAEARPSLSEAIRP